MKALAIIFTLALLAGCGSRTEQNATPANQAPPASTTELTNQARTNAVP
jgi:hypothetical protein